MDIIIIAYCYVLCTYVFHWIGFDFSYSNDIFQRYSTIIQRFNFTVDLFNTNILSGIIIGGKCSVYVEIQSHVSLYQLFPAVGFRWRSSGAKREFRMFCNGSCYVCNRSSYVLQKSGQVYFAYIRRRNGLYY